MTLHHFVVSGLTNERSIDDGNKKEAKAEGKAKAKAEAEV